MTPRPYLQTPTLIRCRCGSWLPRGSTGERDEKGNWYNCFACRPRSTSKGV